MSNVDTHRLLHELFNRRDWDAMDAHQREDLTYTDMSRGLTFKSLDDFKGWLREWTPPSRTPPRPREDDQRILTVVDQPVDHADRCEVEVLGEHGPFEDRAFQGSGYGGWEPEADAWR